MRDAAKRCIGPTALVLALFSATYPSSKGNHTKGDPVFSIDLSQGDHERVFRVGSKLTVVEENAGFEVVLVPATRAYDPEANGWVAFPDFGSFNKIGDDGGLLDVSMNRDGSVDMDGDEPNICEVGAPESQEFLAAINTRFGTTYRLDQFAGG